MKFLTLALTATLANTLQIYDPEADNPALDQNLAETGDSATYTLDEQDVEDLFSNDEEDVKSAIENCHDCDVTINITNIYDSEGQLVDEDIDIVDVDGEDNEVEEEEETAEEAAAREQAEYDEGIAAGTEAAQEALEIQREAGYNATYQESFEAAFYSVHPRSASSEPPAGAHAQIQDELGEEDAVTISSYDRGFAAGIEQAQTAAYEEGQENGRTAGNAAGLEAAETAITVESFTFTSDDEGGAGTCMRRTRVFLADEATLMDSADHTEPNNDACCVAGIADNNEQLARACEIVQTYEVVQTGDVKQCSLSVDAYSPVDDATANLGSYPNIPMKECCIAGDDQQDDALIEGACEMQTTVALVDNQCTVTEDFVDNYRDVVKSSTREEGDDHCCLAFQETGDEDLLDACEMTRTFNYPQADACTSTLQFITSDGTVVNQSTEPHDQDVCCQQYSETAENAVNLLEACEADETFQYAGDACTSTTQYRTVAGEVMHTASADHEASECCWWGQEMGLPVFDEFGSTEPLYEGCPWQEETFTDGVCYKKMARDIDGNLFEELVAYENPINEPNCCALAIAAGDDEMWNACRGDDYTVEEAFNFTSFTECTKTFEIKLGDEVLATKTEDADCPCQEEITLEWEDTKGWEVAMWLEEVAKPHFQCLVDAGASGYATGQSFNAFHRNMPDVECQTLAGQCHGPGTGREGNLKNYKMTFWHGFPISIFRTKPNSSYLDVIHLKSKWTRHGPEFTFYYDNYFYNRMWTHGGQSGAKTYLPEPNPQEPNQSQAPFYTGDGEPRWESLHHWCDYVPNPNQQHQTWGQICDYDPEVDELTKQRN